MKFSTPVDAWNRFWFEPSSPVPMALFRILISALLLQDAVWMRLCDWRLYYSSHSLIPPATFIRLWWGTAMRFDLIDLLPTDWLRLGFLYVYIVSILFVMFGLSTRRSSIAAFLLCLSLYNHFPLINSGADVFLKIALLIIAVSNAGDAFSLDSLFSSLRSDWRKFGFRPVYKPQWAIRVLQLQVCFVYTVSFLSKLHSPQWLNGLTVYYMTRSPDLARFDVPYIFNHLWSLKLLTWCALIVEGCFPILVWIPACRYIVLICGALLHLGIEWVCNIPLFELAMLASYVAFVPVEDWRRLLNWLRRCGSKFALKRYSLFFDSAVTTHVCLVGFLHRLDVFSRLNIQENPNKQKEEGREPSLVLVWNNSELRGFDAARHICLLLPLAWILVPFLFVPVFAHGSSLVFRLVSDRYRAACKERNFLIDSFSNLRYNTLYQHLLLFVLCVGLVCVFGLPRQIFESQRSVRRIEVLDGERMKLLQEIQSYPRDNRPSALLESLAWVNFQEQRRSEAEGDFLKLFNSAKEKVSDSFDPNYARALLNLGIFYRDENDFVAAEHYFSMLKTYDEQFLREGLSMSGDAIAATKARDLSNLSLVIYMRAESIIDGEERRKLLEKALSLSAEGEKLLFLRGSDRAIGNLMSIRYVILRELGDSRRAAAAKRVSAESLSKSHNQTIEP